MEIKQSLVYVCESVWVWCHKKGNNEKWHDFFHDEVICLYGLYAESTGLLFRGSPREK
jgi:hypothetical protein